MAKINQESRRELFTKKIMIILNALDHLRDSIDLFNKYKINYTKSSNKKNEQLLMDARDSMIQYFEYCSYLFYDALLVKITIVQDKNDLCIAYDIHDLKKHQLSHEEIVEIVEPQIPELYHFMRSKVEKIIKHLLKQYKKPEINRAFCIVLSTSLFYFFLRNIGRPVRLFSITS